MGILRVSLLVLLLLLCLIPLTAVPRIVYSGASLILPGSGELLLGETTRGATLLGIDLVSLYAFFATQNEIDLQRRSYMKYAEVYAGVPYDMPRNHYQDIQEFPSSDYYNELQETVLRNYYLIYNYDPAAFTQNMQEYLYSGDETWNWQTAANWKEYKNMRARHQRTKMSHNLALSIMLLNRAVSAIDSAILSGKLHEHGTLYFSPSGKEGLMLNYQIGF
ncbi:MAG: hypothetical protein PHY48_04225 [Candidatus Cloacimonetes bacterium]|nr:hypothetical protein [Candidatus Cloacimonadota bacterium]